MEGKQCNTVVAKPIIWILDLSLAYFPLMAVHKSMLYGVIMNFIYCHFCHLHPTHWQFHYHHNVHLPPTDYCYPTLLSSTTLTVLVYPTPLTSTTINATLPDPTDFHYNQHSSTLLPTYYPTLLSSTTISAPLPSSPLVLTLLPSPCLNAATTTKALLIDVILNPIRTTQ